MPRVGREQSGEDYKSQSPNLRDVMIEIGSGPRQMSRISGMSYNIIQYMWKNNEEQ